MEKKILIWLDSPETENVSALFTVSHKKQLICHSAPREKAVEAISHFMYEMAEEGK